MTDKSACRVAIVGGGISGLAVAHALARARENGAPVDEFLLEGSDTAGGLIQTEHVQGFTIELGPDSFLTAKRDAADLCAELGIAGSLMGSNDGRGRTLILHRGRLRPMPSGLALFVPTKLLSMAASPLIPLGSKAAILRDALRRKPRASAGDAEDESVSAFVSRHLGRGVLRTIAEPLIAGVYGADAGELSAQAVLPRLVQVEKKRGSLVRGMLAARTDRARSGPLFTTLADGMAALPRAIVEELNGHRPIRLHFNRKVERIETAEVHDSCPVPSRRYTLLCRDGEKYEADAVVLAASAAACARLLDPINPEASRALGSIPYTPAVTAALAYKQAPAGLPPVFGFLVPRAERRTISACTFVHEKFERRAPAGAALLRCFLGGAREPRAAEWSEEEISSAVRRDLKEILGIVRPPDLLRISRRPEAMPQYRVGHLGRILEIERLVHLTPGIFLAGNAYEGVGVPDCIRSGRVAAKRVCEFAASLTQ